MSINIISIIDHEYLIKGSCKIKFIVLSLNTTLSLLKLAKHSKRQRNQVPNWKNTHSISRTLLTYTKTVKAVFIQMQKLLCSKKSLKKIAMKNQA